MSERVRKIKWSMAAGQRHGKLVAVAPAGRNARRQAVWTFACDCGNQCDALPSDVASSRKLSCGCLTREVNSVIKRKHGYSDAIPEYTSWQRMRDRCKNPNCKSFNWYGGRGVGISSRWDDFGAFLADMGRKPSPKHSLDRIDVNGDYTPENCRWATPKEQANNRRQRVDAAVFEHAGERRHISEWAQTCGMTEKAMRHRMRRGLTLASIIAGEAK